MINGHWYRCKFVSTASQSHIGEDVPCNPELAGLKKRGLDALILPFISPPPPYQTTWKAGPSKAREGTGLLESFSSHIRWDFTMWLFPRMPTDERGCHQMKFSLLCSSLISYLTIHMPQPPRWVQSPYWWARRPRDGNPKFCLHPPDSSHPPLQH